MRTFQHIAPRARLVLSAIALGPLILLSSPPQQRITVPNSVCVVTASGVLVATTCPEPDPWFGTGRERASVGAEICWWRADTERLSEIRGVGESVANRLAEYRDAGGVPTLAGLQDVRGVGESLASRIVLAVGTRCPRVGPT